MTTTPRHLAARAASEAATQAGHFGKLLDGLLGDLAKAAGVATYGGSVRAAESRLGQLVAHGPDIVLRRLALGPDGGVAALVAFASGLVDSQMVDQDALGRLQTPALWAGAGTAPTAVYARARDLLIRVGQVGEERRWDALLCWLTSGATLVFVDGAPAVLVLDTIKLPARAIGAAQSEPSIQGPQEAFNEDIWTHLSQIRHRIHSPDLHFDAVQIGVYTKTTVMVAYLDGLTNPAFVRAVKERIGRVRRDYVQNAQEVGPYLPERRASLLPLFRTTERVDWVVRDLMNGKVAVLVDGDAFVITLPTTVIDYFQTAQDYAFSGWEASLTRMVRAIGSLLGLYLMPMYIALFSVNPDLVPTKLVLAVAGSREGIPFPPVMEVVIMWTIIEILREAATRLPKQLGTTIGTVGAVVVGTAIVKAGIVDAIMIVTVTLSALGLFTNPTLQMAGAFRWLFWALIFGAYVFGVLGILLVSVAAIAYAASLETMGVPYLAPFAPLRVQSLGDTLVRLSIPHLTARPESLRPLDEAKAARVAPPRPLPEVAAIAAQVEAQEDGVR